MTALSNLKNKQTTSDRHKWAGYWMERESSDQYRLEISTLAWVWYTPTHGPEQWRLGSFFEWHARLIQLVCISTLRVILIRVFYSLNLFYSHFLQFSRYTHSNWHNNNSLRVYYVIMGSVLFSLSRCTKWPPEVEPVWRLWGRHQYDCGWLELQMVNGSNQVPHAQSAPVRRLLLIFGTVRCPKYYTYILVRVFFVGFDDIQRECLFHI